MTTFFIKKRKFSPSQEAVARTFNKLNKSVTPSQVASYLKIHPETAKKRIRELEKKGYVKCDLEGNRLYCKRIKKIEID